MVKRTYKSLSTSEADQSTEQCDAIEDTEYDEYGEIICKKLKKQKKQKIDPMKSYLETMDWFKQFSDDVKPKTDDKNIPWVEKFRPDTLDDVIAQTHVIKSLKQFIKNKQLPHLLLYGPSGIGKTSTIMACAREMYGDNYSLMVLTINASEERGIDVYRGKVKDFVTTKGIYTDKNASLYKLVILDEADAMTIDAQAMLRSLIENHTENVRFCLICNCVKKINYALQSRCTCFKFSPLSKSALTIKLNEIAKKTNIKLTSSGIDMIMKVSKGDMRKAVNILQTTNMGYSEINSTSVANCTGYPTPEHMNNIYKILIDEKLEGAYNKIDDIIKTHGYSINDMIVELTNLVMNSFIATKDMQINRFRYIINELRKLELNSTSSPNDILQLYGIISIFKIS